MNARIFLVLVAWTFGSFASRGDDAAETKAKAHDANATITGMVMQVRGVDSPCSLSGKAVFLDVVATDPHQQYTAVSFTLPFSALAGFEGRTVSVTGFLKDSPIIVSNLSQIAEQREAVGDNTTPLTRTLSLDAICALADQGKVKRRLYLKGEFRVTESGTSRAVLRDAKRPDDQSPRVVVEYPLGDVPPKEGQRLTRDALRPYLVTEVRRGADGVITVYVREIMNQ